MNILKYDCSTDIKPIIKQLEEGNLVVYPTDTIYGIGANIKNEQAIKKVYSTKNRPLNKPLSVCFHDFKQLEDYVYLNDKIKRIIKELLPGPYTLLLKKTENINPLITSNSDIIGVRIPDNEVCNKLTSLFPITTTSANITNKKTPDNIKEIKMQLNNNITTYIDVGVLENNKASTILDLTGSKPKLIREGFCDKNLLQDILKINL